MQKDKKNSSSSISHTSMELVLQPEIQELLDSFAAALRVRVVFFGPTGEVLLRGRGEGNCSYCAMVQKCYGLEKCEVLDCAKLSLARRTGEFQSYRCHGGLNEVIMPLNIGGTHLGSIMLGQFRRRGERSPLEGNPAASRAFCKCPVFSEESIRAFSRVLLLLTDYVTRKELVHAGGDHLFFQVRQFLEERFRENVPISEAARLLGRSVSSLAHYLQKEHGTSYKRMLLERKLQYVEQALQANPRDSIKRLAFEVGFADAGYFSRLYKKYRGRTVSELFGK